MWFSSCAVCVWIVSPSSCKCWSVLIPVVWSNRKPKWSPAVALPSSFGVTSAAGCAPFSDRGTERPNETVLCRASSQRWICKAERWWCSSTSWAVLCLSLKTIFASCIYFKWTEKWDEMAEKLAVDFVFFIIPQSLKFYCTVQIRVFL